ncbi:hypothetical protein [Shewanella sp.]|uniref:hypothetical protein n=1 Tax=Shewanella sp. TaxID=50422 RepID=UPI003A96D0B9
MQRPAPRDFIVIAHSRCWLSLLPNVHAVQSSLKGSLGLSAKSKMKPSSSIQVDSGNWQSLYLPSTDNQYIWHEQQGTLTLPAGNHRLIIRVDYGEPNLDWFRLQ